MTARSLQLSERPSPMRSISSAAAAIVALLLAASAPVLAQTSAAPAALPHKPVPYAQLRPRAAKPPTQSPQPAAAAPGSAASATAPGTPPAQASGAAPQPPVSPVPAGGARFTPADPLPAAELEAFVDGVVRDAMAREHVAGVTVAVVQNGQVILKKGYGFASLAGRRAVDPDRTLFRLGSVSKTFTWIALMKEVEAGRIRLDRPANLYLPEKIQVRDQGYDTPVRVSDLMAHSAGFEDRTLGQMVERNPDRVRPLELYLRQERPGRVHAPGVVSSYSNYGAALAGEAVTYTTGKTFERVIDDEIVTPLGLTHTTFRERRPAREGLPAPMPAALAGDVAEGYRWTPAGFQARPYEYVGQLAPAAAGSSTAGDMASYMLMMLGGGQLGGAVIYGPRTAEAFRTPLRRTPPGVNGWAHGFQVRDLPGGFKGYGQDGSTLSFTANMVTVPALGLGVFVATNTDTGEALANRLPEQVVRQFYARPAAFPRTGDPVLVAGAAAFEGYYLTTRRAYRGLEGFVDRLSGGARVRVTADGRLMTTDHKGASLWALDGAATDGRFLGVDDDQRLAFTMTASRASAYQTAGGDALMERAPLWGQPMILGFLAALAAAVSLAVPVGLILRNRRDFRENAIQSRASLLQNIQAALWLAALALFGLWLSRSGDAAQVMYRWPGALLFTASACALVAAALTVLTVIAIPAIWRGGRRVDSWSALRKLAYTFTALAYAAFAVVLGLWGGLSPWS